MKLAKILINALVITGLSASTAFAKTSTILKAEPVKAADIKISAQQMLKTELKALTIEFAPMVNTNNVKQANNRKGKTPLLAKHTLIAE
jgi:hypothetical protein